MRLLITGVSGFVGAHLVRALRQRGTSVAGAYLGPAPDLPAVDLFEVDLADLAGLREVVRQTRPDGVIHLAGLSHVGESWERMPQYFQVNVLGTENLLRAARGRPVVLASSSEVYGDVPEEEQPISEDREVAPGNPYALTKAAAERLVLAEGGIVVRCFNLAGPGQTSDFVLPAFALQLHEIASGLRPPVVRVGNVEARRDFVHVGDAAEAYCLIQERGASGQIYNLASGRAHSVGEVLERLQEVAGVCARVEMDPERLRPVDIPLLRGDPGRLAALGWQPRHSLEDALRELWQATVQN